MKKWAYQILVILFIVNAASFPAVAEIDCNKVYTNVDLNYNLANISEASACCVSMCGGVGCIDLTGACSCSSGCSDPIPSERNDCDKVAMCCFDELEYYDKYPECCELNDKFEYVASYYGDERGNPDKLKPESQCCIKDAPKNTQGTVTQTCCEGLMGGYRNGNVWVGGSSSSDGDEVCCKQGYPNNYNGKLTKACCEFYGTELKFEKPDNTHELTGVESHCYFYEDPVTREASCCAKDSRRNCDADKDKYIGEYVSFNCCYAAQGVVMVNGKRVSKEELYKYKNIEQSRNAWVCCTTFGYTGAGATGCIPKEGVTSDFNDNDNGE